MSACVTAWLAVHTSDAPGASVAGIAGVQGPRTTPGSDTVTPVSVWLPVLVAVSEGGLTSPIESYGPGDVTVLSTSMAGLCVIGSVSSPASGPVSFESPMATFRY